MTAGPTWVRFFPSDWLGGTRGLTMAEAGCYITLIAMMYERGAPLSFDDAALARSCGATARNFQSALRTLIDRGHITKTDEGLCAPIISEWAAAEPRAPIPKGVRSAVIERDGFTCAYCGVEPSKIHLDHIVPISRGGANNSENLTVSCSACNLSKGARTPEEWRR